uniref:Uncharacterized protein n=1 Tax=Cannabis sativa TaxID=3483 RepID=A0A803R4W7_CANSA
MLSIDRESFSFDFKSSKSDLVCHSSVYKYCDLGAYKSSSNYSTQVDRHTWIQKRGKISIMICICVYCWIYFTRI